MASTGSGSGEGGANTAAPAREGGRFGRRGSRTGAPPSSSPPGLSRSESAILSPGESAGGRALGLGATVAGAPANTGSDRFRRARCSGESAARFSCLRSRLRLLARFCPTHEQATRGSGCVRERWGRRACIRKQNSLACAGFRVRCATLAQACVLAPDHRLHRARQPAEGQRPRRACADFNGASATATPGSRRRRIARPRPKRRAQAKAYRGFRRRHSQPPWRSRWSC